MFRSMFRWLLLLIVLASLGGAVGYLAAGRGTPPVLAINKPERLAGRTGTLEVTAEAPGAVFTELRIVLEQNGRTLPLFSLDDPQSSQSAETEGNRITITRPFGKAAIPDLAAGPARIVVSATRPAFFDLRTLSASSARDIQVKLDPPAVSVLSTNHYINHGGSEAVVYRVAPADTASGVRVGNLEYQGYPADAGDPSVKIAFFALLHEQDLTTPV